jgi:hypothetical protein
MEHEALQAWMRVKMKMLKITPNLPNRTALFQIEIMFGEDSTAPKVIEEWTVADETIMKFADNYNEGLIRYVESLRAEGKDFLRVRVNVEGAILA